MGWFDRRRPSSRQEQAREAIEGSSQQAVWDERQQSRRKQQLQRVDKIGCDKLLATLWSAPPDHAVELFLAAARNGIVAMGWDLLCPRCRGAKSRVSRLHELPKGAHCSSCNIDYERNFSRNVELTFHPEPWIRPLPDGEMCALGQGSARHVKFQGEVAAQSSKSFDLSLAPGPYRFRTVEAGAEVDSEIDADGVIPTLVARGRDILLEGANGRNELAIRNESDRPLVFVVELDALTGERVIAMPAFRRLCPEQLLRPGDNAEIGWIAIMFTDLKGSTELYDALGDVTAYNLVRDHFAFLSDRVERKDVASRPSWGLCTAYYVDASCNLGSRYDWVTRNIRVQTRFGGYADAVCVPKAQVFVRPEGMSAQESASIPVNYLTAWQLIIVMGGLKPSETVLIHSAGGGVGIAATQIAKHSARGSSEPRRPPSTANCAHSASIT